MKLENDCEMVRKGAISLQNISYPKQQSVESNKKKGTKPNLLKWPGSKRQLLPEIIARLPFTWNTYYEPFVGGASVFFDLCKRELVTPSAVISDSNADLISLYTIVRESPETVIACVSALAEEISEERYYLVRKLFNAERAAPATQRAAWFLYLNHLAFNGLYRVNRKGEFNAPYCHPEKYGGGGSRKHTAAEIVRPDVVREASAALSSAVIRHADFRTVLETVKAGDFVYLDPPYWPRNVTSNFTAYAGTFGPEEQGALAGCAMDLEARGVQWMLSNSDVWSVRELYKRFRIETVMARRGINCKAGGRGKVAEVLVRNY